MKAPEWLWGTTGFWLHSRLREAQEFCTFSRSSDITRSITGPDVEWGLRRQRPMWTSDQGPEQILETLANTSVANWQPRVEPSPSQSHAPGMLSKSSLPGLQDFIPFLEIKSVLTAPRQICYLPVFESDLTLKGEGREQGTTIKRMTEPGHNKDWLEPTRPNGAKDLTSSRFFPNIAWQIPCCSLMRPWTEDPTWDAVHRLLTAWGTKWVLSQASTFAVTCYVAIGNRERLYFLPCCCCCC